MPVEQQERALPRRAGRLLELLRGFLRRADRLLIDRQDDIAARQPQRAVLSLQAEARGDGRRHLLDLDAEPAAADLAVLLELRDDGLRDVGRHRKADADAAAIRRVDRGVDADDLALQVESRAAGIAAVDRRVDLQEIVKLAGMDVPPARRDDAGRYRATEPERIADRDDPIANLRRVAVAKTDIRQRLVGLDLQDRDVGARVAADNLRGVLGVVLQGDGDLCGFTDDVIVGHDGAGRVDDEARAERDAAGAAPLVIRAAAEGARHLLALTAMLV